MKKEDEIITFDARVRDKGQITIPEITREKANLKKGDLLEITAKITRK
jgi:AbrB family looped-hinge helix DNA binding protein